jgi:hypothetical protein
MLPILKKNVFKCFLNRSICLKMPAKSENIEELREENCALRRSLSDRTNELDKWINLAPVVATIGTPPPLLRGGMWPADLCNGRGGAMREVIDIYNHFDSEDMRKSYLSHIPLAGSLMVTRSILLRPSPLYYLRLPLLESLP